MKYKIITILILSVILASIAVAQASTPAANRNDDEHEIHGRGTPNSIPKFLSPNTLGDSELFQSAAGSIGIGTNLPIAKLDVVGNNPQGAIVRANNTAASGSGFGSLAVEGLIGSTNGTAVLGKAAALTGFTTGVEGISASTSSGATGVAGVSQGSTGDTFGVRGFAASPSGVGVQGATTNAGGGVGVFGQSLATSGFAIGVLGTTDATGFSASGMLGNANATSGLNFGVQGSTSSTGGVGVRGFAFASSGTTTGIAGYVNSSMGVAGQFDNTAGGDIVVGQVNGVRQFRVDGTGKVFADGGFQPNGADFAESMAVSGDRSAYSAGDLLVIDPLGNRRLVIARQAYSTLVAGIYSTKPGMLGSTRRDGEPNNTDEIPLAVIGIVPCKVTAENGSIQVGDLLVTSSTPGHAMKGTDRSKMLGAVVGKALEPLRDGKGVMQVLVTLQ